MTADQPGICTAQTVDIICPDGDLLLRVSGKGREGLLLVSSRTLVEASESFSKLLQTKRRGRAPIEFSFTNELSVPDDREALLAICNILHGNHERVPHALTLNVLKEIAQSCNRHQLTGVLSAWIEKWLDRALCNARGDESYAVAAIALDLGISSALGRHACWPSEGTAGRMEETVGGCERSLNGLYFTYSLSKTDVPMQVASSCRKHKSCSKLLQPFEITP